MFLQQLKNALDKESILAGWFSMLDNWSHLEANECYSFSFK